MVLLGDTVTGPAEVDSVDEVLFLAPREQLLRRAADRGQRPGMAFLRDRIRPANEGRLGLRTGVADIPLTHNSLSVNVDRLDVAHRAIAIAMTISCGPRPPLRGDDQENRQTKRRPLVPHAPLALPGSLRESHRPARDWVDTRRAR